MSANYVVDRHGCRLEITDASIDVRIRFRGTVSIPLHTVSAVGTARWRSTRVVQIETPDGVYEWALGDRAVEAARAVADAAGVALIPESMA